MPIIRSPKRPAIHRDDLRRRCVSAQDDRFLSVVYAATRDDEMNRVPWDEERKATFLMEQFLAQKTDYERRFPSALHEIILFRDEPIGRIWVDRREREIRLLDIALLPEYRNRGVGSALIGRLQEEAARENLLLRHCVLKTNAPAIRFYKRLGFIPVDDMGMHELMQWRPQG